MRGRDTGEFRVRVFVVLDLSAPPEYAIVAVKLNRRTAEQIAQKYHRAVVKRYDADKRTD